MMSSSQSLLSTSEINRVLSYSSSSSSSRSSFSFHTKEDVQLIKIRWQRMQIILGKNIVIYPFIGSTFGSSPSPEAIQKLQKSLCDFFETTKRNMYELSNYLMTYEQQNVRNTILAETIVSAWSGYKETAKINIDVLSKLALSGVLSLPEHHQFLLKSILNEIIACFDSKAEPSIDDLQTRHFSQLFQKTLDDLKKNFSALSKKPSCFISYAWGDQTHNSYVRELAYYLKDIGVDVKLDIYDNKVGSIPVYLDLIDKMDYILVIGSPELVEKWDNYCTSGGNRQLVNEYYRGNVVAQEIERILQRKTTKPPDKHGIINVLLKGEHRGSFPSGLDTLPSSDTDFRNPVYYHRAFFKLLERLFPQEVHPVIESCYQELTAAGSKFQLSEQVSIEGLEPKKRKFEASSTTTGSEVDSNSTSTSLSWVRPLSPRHGGANSQLLLSNSSSSQPYSGILSNHEGLSLVSREITSHCPRELTDKQNSSTLKQGIDRSRIISRNNIEALMIINKSFLFRDNLDEILVKTFHAHQSTAMNVVSVVGRHTQLVTCHGLGGVGKTFVAIQYILRHWREYNFCAWITATTREEIYLDYRHLGVQLGYIDDSNKPFDVIAPIIKEKLQASSGKWLIIFDDAENYQMIGDFFPQYGGHVLVTSRNPHWLNAIPVDILSEAEAIKLLCCISENANDEPDKAKLLMKELGYLPLAISQAASYIRVNVITVNEYLQLYQTCRLLLLKDASLANEIGHRHDPVAITWNVSLQKILASNPQAIDLFKYFSFIDANEIPRNLLQPIVTANTELEKPLVYNQLTKLLNDYSMIKISSNVVKMHTLVQTIAQGSCTKEEKTKLINNLITVIGKRLKYNRDNRGSIFEFQKILPHVISLEKHINDLKLITIDIANMFHVIGTYYLDHELNVIEAQKFLKQAVSFKEALLGEENLSTADTYLQLGNAYAWEVGKKEEAEIYIMKSLTIKTKINGEGSIDLVKPLLAKAKTLMNKKKKDSKDGEEAEMTINKVLTILSNEDNQADKAMALHYLGNLAYDRAKMKYNAANDGELKRYGDKWVSERHQESINEFLKAKKCYELSIKIKRSLYSNDIHPEIARTLNQLGSTCYMLKEYQEARKCQEEALKIKTVYYGTENRKDIVSLMHLLGETYFNVSMSEEGINMLKKCLSIKEALYSKDSDEYRKTERLLHSKKQQPKITSLFKSSNNNEDDDVMLIVPDNKNGKEEQKSISICSTHAP